MAGASSAGTVTLASSLLKEVYNPKAFIPHAASLRQAFAHCAIFPTAASRRSLGRVSVPVWPIALSGRLPVVALVGHYPTNKLIGRGPIPSRKTFHPGRCRPRSYPVLAPVSRSYPRARGRLPTCYSPVRRSSTPKGLSARLACVKHAASVRPEPGSNSPSMIYGNPPSPKEEQDNRQRVTATLDKWTAISSQSTEQLTKMSSILQTRPSNQANPLHNEEDQPSHQNMALTFGTLLSSQGTSTHHPRPLGPHAGQLTQTSRPPPPRQTTEQNQQAHDR